MLQLGAFFGPTFATIQDLVPRAVTSTIIAFAIMPINIVGMGLGITLTGIAIDALIERGFEQPRTLVLATLQVFFFISMPCFLYAGLRYQQDREALCKDH